MKIRLTKKHKILIWHLLFSLRNCFDENGMLVEEYYQNVLLVNLKKGEKEVFDNLLKTLLA
jgi:hypothetical protein